MCVLKRRMLLAFAILVSVLSSCQKEDNLDHNPTTSANGTSTNELTISGETSLQFPDVVYSTAQSKFVKEQRTTVVNATLTTADGASLFGDADVITFVDNNGESTTAVLLNNELYLSKQVRIVPEKIIDSPTTRRYISTMCLIHSAMVYDDVLNELEERENILCDFCADRGARRAYQDCMNGEVRHSSNYYYY